jgi:transcriptional regulator with XRE-family HTH domain
MDRRPRQNHRRCETRAPNVRFDPLVYRGHEHPRRHSCAGRAGPTRGRAAPTAGAEASTMPAGLYAERRLLHANDARADESYSAKKNPAAGGGGSEAEGIINQGCEMAKHKTTGPSPIDIHVGSRLRKRRKMAGISQEKLGEGLGLTFQQIQKYEKGVNRIGASRLQQAADILGVPVSFFFEGGTEEPFESDGSAPSPSYIDDFVSSEDGLRLAKAFMQIPRSAVRLRIVALVEELAGGMVG